MLLRSPPPPINQVTRQHYSGGTSVDVNTVIAGGVVPWTTATIDLGVVPPGGSLSFYVYCSFGSDRNFHQVYSTGYLDNVRVVAE